MTEKARGDRWYYSFLPINIAGGATATLIPLIALVLGANAADIGIIVASSSIASVPTFMLWGRLSDRLGKRRVFVVLGFGGMAASLLFMAVSTEITHLYLANLMLGALSSASVVGTVLIMEMSERKEWPNRLAIFSLIGGLGYIGGLAIGAVWLAALTSPWGVGGSMRALFLAGALLSVLSGLMAWRLIKDPAVGIKRSSISLAENIYLAIERVRYLPIKLLHFFDFFEHRGKKQDYSGTLKSYYLSVILLFSGFTAFYTMFPIFLAGPLGFDGSHIFVVYIASQVVSAAIYSRVGGVISKIGARKVQMAGSVARILLFPSFLTLLWLPVGLNVTFILALVIHGLIGASWALINVSGSTIISRLAPTDGHAQTFGLYNAVQGVGSIIGPLIGGFTVVAAGYVGGFALSSILILAGVALLAALRIQEK